MSFLTWPTAVFPIMIQIVYPELLIKASRTSFPILTEISASNIDIWRKNKVSGGSPAQFKKLWKRTKRVFNVQCSVSNYFDIQVSSQISNNGQGTQVHIPISLRIDNVSLDCRSTWYFIITLHSTHSRRYTYMAPLKRISPSGLRTVKKGNAMKFDF